MFGFSLWHRTTYAIALLLYDTRLHANSKTECLGSPEAKTRIIYLHGFEQDGNWSAEESTNRQVLQTLAKEHPVRIALPISPFICKNKQRCWASKNNTETLATFGFLKKEAFSCWPHAEKEDYQLLGFSNGGYFAFKLYKLHTDPKLKHILAVGSSGTWDAKRDKISPWSRFTLLVGEKEITLPSAKRFEKELQQSLPDFRVILTPGGHRLDLASLRKLFAQPSEKD